VNSSLILINAALLTWGVGEGMFLIFVPLYLEEMGANPLMIGSIFGVFGLMMMVSHIPAGYLSDRIGRRPLLVAAWLMGGIAAWMMALAPSLWFFVAGYLLYGITAFVSSPLFSYVTAARGNFSTGRVMTLTSAMFNAGMVAGPLLGGWIGDQLGLKATFLIAACVLLVSVALIFFLKPQPRDEHDGAQGSQNNLFQNKKFVIILVVAFLGTFVMYLPQPLTPNFLQNERGVSFTQIGLLGSVGGFGNVAFNLLLGHLNPRLGFILGQGFVGLAALAFWWGNLPVWYALGYFMFGGYRVARLLVFAQVRAFIHQAQMGLAYGFTETVNSLGVILSPLLAGYLYEQDPALIYPLTLGLILFAILVSMILMPYPAQPEHIPLITED
jgi:MFS family permease